MLLSGCVSWNVDDLELEPVRVVEEHRVIPERVGVFLRSALDLCAGVAEPVGPLVDGGARRRLDRDVMKSDRVTVVRGARGRLRLAQADRRRRPPEVVDRLAALALDLADPVVAERREQVAVERQAALDRRDDEVDVMYAGGGHRRDDFNAPVPTPARARSERPAARRA